MSCSVTIHNDSTPFQSQVVHTYLLLVQLTENRFYKIVKIISNE
jgi:hypothetical protein